MILKYLFQKYKIYFIFFCVIFLVFLVTYFLSNKALIIDQPCMTMSAIKNSYENSLGYIYVQEHSVARLFSFILGSFFLNIFNYFYSDLQLIQVTSLLSISYILFHVLALFLSFLISFRTKRYDISIFTFFIYTFFVLLVIIWPLRECFFTYILWLILLQYLCTNEKIRTFDKLLICLLLLFNFQSYEMFFFLGIIYFLFVCFTFNKYNRENKKVRIIIALTSLITSFYLLYNYYFVTANFFDLSYTPSRYFNDLKNSLMNFYMFPILTSVLGLLFLFLSKLKIKKYMTKVSFSFLIVLFFIFLKNDTIYVYEFDYNGLMYVVPFLYVLLFLYFEFKNIKFKKVSLKNIFLFSLIVGSVNLLYQIKSNFDYYNYFSEMKNLLSKQQSKIYRFPAEVLPKYNKYEDCTDIIIRYYTLQGPSYSTVVFPTKEMPYSSTRSCNSTYYSPKENKIKLHNKYYDIKNKYWDFSDMIDILPIEE